MGIKLTRYALDRRDLFRLTAFGASGLYLANLDAFAADAQCTEIGQSTLTTADIPGVQVLADSKAANLYFFIDGIYTDFYLPRKPDSFVDLETLVAGVPKKFSAFSPAEKLEHRILTNARVSIHCEFEQSADSFIEAVILSDGAQKVLGMRRLTEADAIKNELNLPIAPYVIFDRLNLVAGTPLIITYVKRIKKDKAEVYQYKISAENAGPSRLDFRHLPVTSRLAMSKAFLDDMVGGDGAAGNTKGTHAYSVVGQAAATPAANPAAPFEGAGGYMNSPYLSQRHMPAHTVRARLASLDDKGKFEFHIAKMHGDASSSHYMRYFLVMDPVGRILGGLKRAFGDNEQAVAGADAHFVRNGPLVDKVDPAAIYNRSPFKITDAPFVHIVTEDILDAIAKITFRIR